MAISDICINAVTLVSGGLLSLAEQRPVSQNISTSNMVVTLTRDRIIKVRLTCALELKFDHDMKYPE